MIEGATHEWFLLKSNGYDTTKVKIWKTIHKNQNGKEKEEIN